MFRSRSWFGWNRPKNRLSLEHLKYLYGILDKNTTVSENNRSLLVESLRSIAEILIWGDQHDSSVFDFFLEKNMLSYFLHIMRQKSGGSSFVCVQLLQTLNILFENIRNETSLYYLLSNNHVNSIIVHKFDFSDEDVMGYYILFLKTLSLKLNVHTIHFFYNEHTNDFPLYTEAIKFFNHPESMVRIAVRTISLNVYKVQNASMLRFIRDKTAAPYFSNLVWFIGKHILELDICVRTDIDHQSFHKLSNLVAEHMDHLHYLNDILLLDIDDLNAVLTEHLLHKLFVPLYIFSLTPAPPTASLAVATQNLAAVLNRNVDIDITEITHPRVSSVVALFLLSLVFLVVTHAPLVHALAWVILNGDHGVFKEGAAEILNAYVERREPVIPVFAEPRESLEEALDTISGTPNINAENEETPAMAIGTEAQALDMTVSQELAEKKVATTTLTNITDEEKQILRKTIIIKSDILEEKDKDFANNKNRPFLNLLLTALDCSENDYVALLALCLLHAMTLNRGVKNDWFEQVLSKQYNTSFSYKNKIIERLLDIITLSNQPTCRIRLVTLEIALELLVNLNKPDALEAKLYLSELHQNRLFEARNQSMLVLRNFYKSEDIFLDLFEDEFNEMRKSQLNVEYLCMDSTILLPPTGTPLTGINFMRRLPCGEVEKARRAIRIFLLLRRTCQKILNEVETLLPLTHQLNIVNKDQVLDLNNSDLIACTVITKDASKQRRFLVIDSLQLILVEPDAKLLGWGVAKFVGFLQDVEVLGDKDDSRCLHITVLRGGATHNRTPLLSAKFVFDDHIRCMAAKQRLTKGRSKARQKKMYQIAQLIEMPGQMMSDTSLYALSGLSASSNINQSMSSREHKSLLTSNHRVPGFAAALRRDVSSSSGVSRVQVAQNRNIESVRNSSSGTRMSRRRDSNNTLSTSPSSSKQQSRSRSDGKTSSTQSPRNSSTTSLSKQASSTRESSPFKCRPHSEEIPLDDFQHSRNNSPHARSMGGFSNSNASSREHTPSRSYGGDNINLEPNTILVHKEQHEINYEQENISGVLTAIDAITNLQEAKLSEETSFNGQDDKLVKTNIQTI